MEKFGLTNKPHIFACNIITLENDIPIKCFDKDEANIKFIETAYTTGCDVHEESYTICDDIKKITTTGVRKYLINLLSYC